MVYISRYEEVNLLCSGKLDLIYGPPVICVIWFWKKAKFSASLWCQVFATKNLSEEKRSVLRQATRRLLDSTCVLFCSLVEAGLTDSCLVSVSAPIMLKPYRRPSWKRHHQVREN
jgi:hypothetical protein